MAKCQHAALLRTTNLISTRTDVCLAEPIHTERKYPERAGLNAFARNGLHASMHIIALERATANPDRTIQWR